MAHAQSPHPQERRLLLAAKAALRGMHEGPNAIPRKAVFMPLGVHDATYSRWLNPEEPDFPGLFTLIHIVNITHDPAVFRVLLAGMGEGYSLVDAGSEEPTPASGFQLLGRITRVDAALQSGLARDLEDGVVSLEEAAELLPLAEERKRQADAAVDYLQRLARGRRSA